VARFEQDAPSQPQLGVVFELFEQLFVIVAPHGDVRIQDSHILERQLAKLFVPNAERLGLGAEAAVLAGSKTSDSDEIPTGGGLICQSHSLIGGSIVQNQPTKWRGTLSDYCFDCCAKVVFLVTGGGQNYV
jgi:hypothetical protein